MACNKMVWALMGLCVLSVALIEAAPADDPQAAPAAPAKKNKSSGLANAIYEIIGIVITTVLQSEQVGSIFQRLPENVRADIINEIPEEDRNEAIKAKVSPNAAAALVGGLKDDQGNSVFGAKFEDIKKQTPDQQLQAILNLDAGALAKLAAFDPEALLGNIIKEIDEEKLGKIAVEHLNDIVNALEVSDIRKVFRAIVKFFTED